MQKKLLFISIMLIVLCSLSAVSASEINGTDDAVGVDCDVSAPCDIVSASEINGTDDADLDSDVLSEPSSTDTVSMLSNYDEELIGLSLGDVEIIGDSQDTPQWAMDGFDSSNSQESPYAGISNGVIAWNYTGNVFSSLSIDKDGRIILVNNGHLLYLYTNGTVYAEPLIALDDGSINPSRFFSIENYSISPNNYFTIITEDNGNYLLNFAETDKSISSSGTTTYLGFKKWADTMPVNNVPLFVDKNDGKVHFLCFFPDDLLVMFDFNEIIRDPYSEPYEGYGLISSTRTPTVTESGIWVPTSDGIVVFDLKNFGEEAAPIKTISASVSSRPVADANGNVYFFTSDSISKADSTNGVTKTQAVTGGTGSRMAISSVNKALYSVNSIGTLYKYSLDDLTESEVYDIGTPASTIMTDASGVIYVGTTDGKFYAISDAGEELWSVDTESGSEIKNCAMDNEGNIYFYTAENKVYAINEAPEPQIPEISGGAVVSVENTTLGEGDGKIMMYFYGDNGPVDGSVDVYFNDTKYNAVIGNGVAILNAGSELSCGIYDIYYEYLGGTNYAPSSKVKTDSKFEVGKRDVNITFRVDIASKKIYFEFTDEVTPTGQFSCQIDDGRSYKRALGKTHSIDRTLANGTHTITITYLGDDNHASKTVVDTFDIIKRQPTCNITRDAGNFIFNFTEEAGKSAKITVTFVGPNSFSEGSGWSTDGIITMDVTNKLLNGTYNLTVHLDYYGLEFEGTWDFNYTFDYIKYTISNMTVIPEVPTKPIGTTSTITVVVNVAEGDPVPTGSVSFKAGSATFSASLNENGIAKVRWETWQDYVGSFVRTFTYSGDKNYETASMDVTLVCEPSLNVKLQTENNNVTFSFNDDYNYDNYGVVHIIDNGEYLGNVTGDGSFPNFKASDLDLGEHTFEIIWENTDGHNYTFTESAFLRISGTPQWANTGFDIKNGGNPDYTRLDNVYIIWSNNESINITKYPNNYRREYTGEMSYIYGGVTSYSPIIASDGIIYLNDGYVIYAYDSEGNVLYTKAPGRVVPGLSIYNDTIVIAPRTDEEVVTYDFFTGNSYTGGTNFVSSSFYYPIVGPDGRIYISSEFNNMENNGKWITVLSLNNENKFSWNAAYIDTEAIATPVFDDEGNMWVATENGIRAVNIYSEANVFSDSSISINARPAISDSNIVFYLSKETENSIYALTAEGYLWNTTVSGTVGTTLAIDNENGFVYSVNKEGKLYKYDINDGTETFVYDLGAKAKSIIVDGDSKVYVGDTNGYVTALDSEGNLLWAINLGAPIAGGLAMNNEGIIYAYTNDTLFALGYRNPISIEVTVPEGDYKAFDNVTVTATLNETVEGNVTFTLGDLIKVVPVNGTTAVWTTVLKGGNQTIFATFEGNNDYMSAEGNVTVSAGKLDVEFENVPEVLTFDPSKTNQLIVFFDIIYNGTNVTVGSIAGYDENNNKLSGTWRYIANNGWRATIRGIGAGYHNITIVYTGDSNYNDANTTFKLISLPTVTPSVKIDNDANEITVDVSVSGNNPTGKFTVTANDEIVANGTIENGIGSVTFDKLEPDSYEIKVIYEGDENIPANNGTTSIKIPRTSQWPNVGNDPQNSGNSIATRGDGVSIIWEAAINGDLRSSAIIDSFGNVYVNDGSKVYSFDSNGNLRWSGGVGTAGIAIFNDELIFDSQANNAMIILNATTGQNIGGNFWYASSVCPAIFMDGKIYVVTQYGYNTGGGWSGSHWIDIFSYDGPNDYGVGVCDGIFIVEVTGIGYGASGVLAAPTFDKNGFVYVNTAKGFRIVNVETDTAVFSDTNIKALGRAVVDANNIAYILEQNTQGIFAINTEGIVWNVTVTGGIGSTLAVDNENGFLYSVNANGTLYKYSTTDGSEIKVYDLNSTGVSIILDADSNVYVSTANGNVTAFNSDGDLLWTINLGSKITGQLAMDNNGIIYAVADKKLYALGADANLNVEAENVTVFDEETITVTIAEGATGNVTIIVNGEENEVPIEDGTATLDLGELPAGDYTVTVYYNGDATYGPAYAETAFEISKVDAEITADVVASIEETTITVTLPEDATGRVFVTVNGKGYFAEAEDGQAVISIIGLESGNYTAEVTYEGDDNYNNASIEVDINVPEEPVIEPLDPELEVIVDDTAVVVSLDEMASGYVVVTVGNESLFFEYEGDSIVVDLSDLEPGNYTVSVIYSGDEFFASAEDSVEVSIPEVEPLDPELEVSVNDTLVTVSLDEMAAGYVVVTVGNESLFFEYEGDPIVVDFSYLGPGNYSVDVAYSGDEFFASAEDSVEVSIPEVEPLDPGLEVDIQNTTIAVSINENATGLVIITVGDISFVMDADELEPVDVSEFLTNGTYPVTVEYLGDDVFEGAEFIGGSVTVPSEPVIEPKDPNLKATAANATITVSVDKDATGNVLVDVDGQGYYAPIKDGQAVINAIGLDEGKYDAVVTYVGDDIFAPANATVSITVPKKEDPTPEPVDPKANISISEDGVEIALPEDATGYLLVDVDGTGYYTTVKDGKASLDLPELAPGNHSVTVTYTGDKKYDSANATKTIEVEGPVETIISENLTKVEKSPDRFEATFTDAQGNPLANTDVKFIISGTTYTRTTDATGKAGMNINLPAGNYTVTVVNPVTNESKVNSITVLPRIESSDLTKYFKNASQFLVKVFDDEGNPVKAGEVVTFNINGVFYNRTTDNNGIAKLSINLIAGNYTITTEYKGCKAANNIEVLPILTAKDLTKKYGQAGAFEATLVDSQGKPYANQQVVFNINGVFYKRTTGSNGVAKLNINLQAGEYIITSSYNGFNIANKVTVTA